MSNLSNHKNNPRLGGLTLGVLDFLKIAGRFSVNTLEIMDGVLRSCPIPQKSEYVKWRHDKLFPRSREYKLLARFDSKKKLSLILTRLRSRGLVQFSGSKKRGFWSLTHEGKNIVINRNDIAPLIKSSKSILVIFDIPENKRAYRYWLRSELTAVGFKKLQKSVWKGDYLLPRDFINYIDEYKLGDFIHIFSIDNYGTLENTSQS